MNTEKTFYIVYYAKKHKKHITRHGKSTTRKADMVHLKKVFPIMFIMI